MQNIIELLKPLDLGQPTLCEDGAVVYKYTLSLDEELFHLMQACKENNLEVRISPVLVKEEFGYSHNRWSAEVPALSILVWEKE